VDFMELPVSVPPVGLTALAPNGAWAQRLDSPAPDATVSVHDCGAHPRIAEANSPYNGSVTPDPSVHDCGIYFSTPGTRSPFQKIVDGTKEDHVGPICTTQIEGPRRRWVVGVTAAGIRFSWGDVPGKSAPQEWISWICEYPWPPD
jgi:hypothetical protein